MSAGISGQLVHREDGVGTLVGVSHNLLHNAGPSACGPRTRTVRFHPMVVHHSADANGVDGDLAGGEQVGCFANLRSIDAAVAEALPLLSAGEDVDGKVAREPEQIFAARDIAQIAGQIAESLKGHGHAACILEGGGLGLSSAHAGDARCACTGGKAAHHRG